MKLMFSIAGGIILGGGVLLIAHEAYTAYQAREALAAVSVAIEDSSREMQSSIEERRLKAQQAANLRADQQIILKQRAAQQSRDAVAKSREAIATEERKRRAFSAYYQPAADCLSATTMDKNVECGNRYIQAQREFEVSWARGDFP